MAVQTAGKMAGSMDAHMVVWTAVPKVERWVAYSALQWAKCSAVMTVLPPAVCSVGLMAGQREFAKEPQKAERWGERTVVAKAAWMVVCLVGSWDETLAKHLAVQRVVQKAVRSVDCLVGSSVDC